MPSFQVQMKQVIKTLKSVTKWVTEWRSYMIGCLIVGVSSLAIALSKWKVGNSPLFVFRGACQRFHSSEPVTEGVSTLSIHVLWKAGPARCVWLTKLGPSRPPECENLLSATKYFNVFNAPLNKSVSVCMCETTPCPSSRNITSCEDDMKRPINCFYKNAVVPATPVAGSEQPSPNPTLRAEHHSTTCLPGPQ